ncbi:putative F-box domain, kelch-type beta propeller, F-box associated interaction [Helianthus annuus]|nr:putative F-box domain, kelch-type beta propeller, F-box associated interaction [Helianthus annuus]
MEDVLPESVMLDVLSRLPVKAIIRFKCVCRKWRDLVSDPYFVHLHHSRSREALMIDWQGSLEWVEMMEHEDEYHLHPVKSLSILIDPSFSFAGSVNGLICCYRPYDSVYILNPVLKEYMILPKPQLENVIYTYGFGVSTAGEYKVILCNRTVSFVQNKVYRTVNTLVHTIGTDQWRVLRQTPNPPIPIRNGPGVFLNSHVYWLGYGQVYGFDLNTETFELFPSPSGRYRKSKLGVLKGRLSLIIYGPSELEVWVMNGRTVGFFGPCGSPTIILIGPFGFIYLE